MKYELYPPEAPNMGKLFVNHQATGRSGHLSHALLEYRKGCVLAFYSNCSGKRNRWAPGHNGFGWLEFKRSTDYGETWDNGTVLDYSMQCLLNEPFTVSCEKAVSPAEDEIVALCIRRIPYTIRSSVAVLQQIPITVEEAAISLGCSKLEAFFKATVPMMRNGILSGAILSWVTIITELSTGVILYNRKTITLTLAIYAQVTRGSDGPAAALATILNVLTISSMLVFMKVSKNKDITF